MKNRTKAAFGMALLATTLATGTARAQQAPTTTVTVEASTRAKDLASDLLFNNDARTLINAGKVSLALENNLPNSFNNGNDYVAISYNAKIGTWDIAPGARFDSNVLREASLYAGKTFGLTEAQRQNPQATTLAQRMFDGTRLNTLTVADNRHFGMFRTIVDDINVGNVKVDAGFGYKAFDWAKGIKAHYGNTNDNGGFDSLAGIQAKNGTFGAWGATAENKAWGATALVDKPNVGIMAFGKHSPDHTHFVGTWISLGNDGKRFSETYMPSSGLSNPYVPAVGQFFATDMTDQTVPPLTGSAGSSLANCGKVNMEIVVMERPGAQYAQALVGTKVHSFANGSTLHFGVGQRVATDGSRQHHTALEGMYNIPQRSFLGENLGLRIEARRAPDLVGSIRLIYTK